MTQWYTRDAGTGVSGGPFETAAVESALDAGKLSPNDMVRRDGDGAWIVVADHLSFRSHPKCLARRRSGSSEQVNIPSNVPAGAALWFAAVGAYFGVVFIKCHSPSVAAQSEAESLARYAGVAVGTLLFALAVVGIASFLKPRRTQREKVTTFLLVNVVLIALSITTEFAKQAVEAHKATRAPVTQ